MARLILSTPDGQRTVELRAKNSLGRHPDNSIQLLDKIVSKEHCLIELRGTQFVLRDLGSLNGTYVNGQRVNGELLLTEGAELAMGQTSARFEGAGDLPQAPASSGGWDHPTAAIPGSAGQRVPAAGFQASPAVAGASGQLQANVPGRGGSAPGQGAIAPGQGNAAPGVPPANSSRRIGMKTRVDLNDQARSIGTQIDATQKGFLPYEQLKNDQAQLAADYERLRMSHELAREIALERDLEILLDKILETIFRFVPS